MKLKIKQSKTSLEKKMLTCAIMHTEFLRQYRHIYRSGNLSTPYGDWLSEACIAYFVRYNTAPNKDIIDLFKSAVKTNKLAKGLEDVTKSFLTGLDFETEFTLNHGYFANKVKEYFILQAHRILRDKLSLALEEKNADLCEKAVLETKRVELTVAQVCNPFEDKQKVMDAFLKQDKQLFKLPGALGRMINPQLKTKRFLALLGTAKRGKTWWLYHLAKTAKRYGNHVAMFAAGDEDEDSSLVRLGTMTTGKQTDTEYCGPYARPVFDCLSNQKGTCNKTCRKKMCPPLPELTKEEEERMSGERWLETCPKHVPCTACRNQAGSLNSYLPAVWYVPRTVEQLQWQDAWKAMNRFQKFTPKSSVKLFTYPSNTLTASEIEHQLDLAYDMEGWAPTVIIVDYPDIMASESNDKENRHKENNKWTNLRKISQTRDVCLIVVSQSNIGGYGSDSLEEGNVNEDRRKLDHVTALYALNQTDSEKRKKIMRIGPLLQRKGKFDVEYQVMVLQALEQGQPFIDSQLVYRQKRAKEKGK